MALFGTIDQFDIHDDEFGEYLERVEQYYVANDIVDDKKVAVFITVVGKETYGVLRSLLAPTKPQDKNFKQISEALLRRLNPTPIIIAERFKFYERKQKDSEQLSDFIAGVRKLAATCEFGDFLPEALRDRIVCGISDVKTRKRLLVERNLTLNRAIEIATSLEGVEKENQLMSSMTAIKSEESEILKFNDNKDKRKCYRCGNKYHLANKCKFINSNCNSCGMRGHISVACRRKLHAPNNLADKPDVQTASKGEVIGKVVQAPVMSSNEEDELFYIYTIRGNNFPYLISLDVCGGGGRGGH